MNIERPKGDGARTRGKGRGGRGDRLAEELRGRLPQSGENRRGGENTGSTSSEQVKQIVPEVKTSRDFSNEELEVLKEHQDFRWYVEGVEKHFLKRTAEENPDISEIDRLAIFEQDMKTNLAKDIKFVIEQGGMTDWEEFLKQKDSIDRQTPKDVEPDAQTSDAQIENLHSEGDDDSRKSELGLRDDENNAQVDGAVDKNISGNIQATEQTTPLVEAVDNSEIEGSPEIKQAVKFANDLYEKFMEFEEGQLNQNEFNGFYNKRPDFIKGYNFMGPDDDFKTRKIEMPYACPGLKFLERDFNSHTVFGFEQNGELFIFPPPGKDNTGSNYGLWLNTDFGIETYFPDIAETHRRDGRGLFGRNTRIKKVFKPFVFSKGENGAWQIKKNSDGRPILGDVVYKEDGKEVHLNQEIAEANLRGEVDKKRQ